MAKLCPSCNLQNVDGARFCRQCGQTLPLPPSPVGYASPTAPIAPSYTPAVGTAPAYGSLYPPGYAPPPGVQLPWAGFMARFGAVLIDVLIYLVLLMPGYVLMFASTDARGEPSPLGVVALLFSIVASFGFIFYCIYLLGRDGATPGKKALGITCLDQSGAPLGFGRAFLRELFKWYISMQICWLGCLWMLWDREKQTWHDKVLSTHVYQK